MLEQNILVISVVAILIPIVSFLYYFIAKLAINSGIDEHQSRKKGLNRWILVILVLIYLGGYTYAVKPFGHSDSEAVYQASNEINLSVILGLIYLCLEVPYQLVKSASKDIAEALLAAGEDRRTVARQKAAETLAMIMGRKLKVSCELQAFSSNEEFVFVTYILGDKPIATRLKLNQADKPDSWKKLGDWIIGSYQNQKAQ